MASILIADDNPAVRALLKEVVSQEPAWTVCGEAINGRQAVQMARELKPDLLLLDVSMPELNGIYAAEEILKSTPNIPVVLFTLHQNAELDREAKRIGVRKVISKTEGMIALVQELEKILGKHAPAPVGPLAVGGKFSLEANPLDSISAPQGKSAEKPNIC